MNLFRIIFALFLLSASTSYATTEEKLNDSDETLNSCQLMVENVHQLRTREAIFLERFPKHLESFVELVTSVKSSDEFVEKATSTDMRQFLFRVETLDKFYLDYFKNLRIFGALDVAFLKAKRLEGLLGAVVDANSLLKKATAWKRPQKELDFLNNELLEKKKDLATCYEEDWRLPKIPALEQLKATMDGMVVPSQKEDAKYVRARIAEQVKDIRDTNYDPNILEGSNPEEKKVSWHKHKRDLRKIAIFFNSMLGKIDFIEKKVPKRMKPYQELSDVARSYMKVDQSDLSADIKHVVYYYQYDYNALSFFINRFDQIKKWGEIHDELMRVAMAVGTYANEAEADKAIVTLLKQQIPDWKPWKAEAAIAKKQLDDSGLLDDLVKGAN